MPATPPADAWDDGGLPPFASVQEVAYGSAMARWDSLRLEVWESDPPVEDVVPLTDEDLLERLGSAPSAADLLLLESIDPMGLSSKAAVLDYLRAAERVDAYAAALKARARVALAGVESSGELVAEIHVEQELAVATRTSAYSAGMAIERARVLTATFPSFLTALEAGQISEAHCRELVERTRTCTDPDALAAVERVTLPKARRMTPKQFGHAGREGGRGPRPGRGGPVPAGAGAALGVDPRARGRHVLPRHGPRHPDDHRDQGHPRRRRGRAARAARRRRGPARRGGGRRDAARAAPTRSPPASSAPPIRPATSTGHRHPPPCRCSSSSTWQTLRGETDRHCLLDGQPVPAQIGRELAGYATAFRRMVTDPVDGHLLDYGDLTYLPAPLRTYVLARDGGCRAPGCTQPRPPPPADGPRHTVPRRTLRPGEHRRDLPRAPPGSRPPGHTNIENSNADGSCDWITAWGQRIHIPARPFLHDPADHPTRHATPTRHHPSRTHPSDTLRASPHAVETHAGVPAAPRVARGGAPGVTRVGCPARLPRRR